MPTPDRIRQDAREAEAQLAALGEAARNGTQPSNDPAAPPTSLDDRAPGNEPHPNAVANEPTEPTGESGPITAEAYAELRQQYETLQGLHNRDRAKMSGIEQQLAGMQQMLEAQAVVMRQQPTTPTPPAAAVPSASALTADEIKEYGEDLIDVIKRVATDTWHSAISSMLNDIQRLRTQLGNATQQLQSTSSLVQDSAEVTFNSRMDKLVRDAAGNPDWQAINTSHLTSGDTKFVDWLAQIGQDSDETRQNVLQRAYQRKDADKCAGIFNAFKAANGMATGNGTTAVPNTPSTASAANPADAIVSPSPVAPQAPSTARGKGNQKVWTLAEITKIYDDNTKGLNRTDAQKAEYKRLTAEIDVATKDGRVKA